MRVLLSWLRDFVDLPAEASEVARRLTLAGLEVEAEQRLDEDLASVVVGEVRTREPVPETKLSVCRVFDGETERQIVCGAQNYAAGDHVPVAKPGAVLPGGKAIGQAKLRGIESFGMLCSGRELGADDGVDGLLILPRDTVPGTPIAKVLGRDDVAFEINVTPNRADALSHLGVARELAALFDVKLNAPEPKLPDAKGDAPAKVDSADPALCARFCGRVLEGVKVGPSPAWLRRRLEAMGQRSINNVVDATNYVMLELGQPLHAYDLDRVAGAQLVARRAKDGETLRTLDGKDRPLSTDDLVIADANGPVGLAGVMGGEDSEVKEATTRLLLESAFFAPDAVRRTARRHAIHSEASHRFERGVDPEGTRRALDRLTEVLLEVAGGRLAGAAVDAHPRPHQRARITLRHARLESVLGTSVPWAEANAIVRRLGLFIAGGRDGETDVEVPGNRLDLTTEIDLVEEVARVRGFELIAPEVPHGAGTDAVEPHAHAAERRLREALAAGGFDEAVNYAFVDPNDLAKVLPDVKPIALRNPLAENQAVMRTTLVPGLLRNASHNLRHGADSLRLYELGRAYLPLESQTGTEKTAGYRVDHEPRRLALVAAGPRTRGWTGGKDAFDFYDLKGALELVLEALHLEAPAFERSKAPHLHPRSAAQLTSGGRVVGTLGELHPKIADAFELPRGVFVAELEADVLVELARLVPRFRPLAKQPASLRDIAWIVDASVEAAAVLREIRRADEQGLVEDATLFDVYAGDKMAEGKKNLAFSLRYRAKDRTLTDDEVARVHAAINERVAKALGAVLRA